MKIQSLLPKGEEDLMEGDLLRHKEGSVIMVQMVDRSHMGHLMKMRQQDAVHKDLQVAIQGEDAVAQAIALLHQVKTKEGIQGTRGGGHQHLHLLLQHHPQRLHQSNQGQREEAIDTRIPHGSARVAWKSSKKEERTSLLFLMMALMVQRIVFLDLHNNSIPLLVENTLKNAPS
jgi:hypothetical protein